MKSFPRDRVLVQGTTANQHELDGVAFAQGALPDVDPLRMWALVDLVEPGGRRYDLDLLILGKHALYLVEMKGYPGKITGNQVDWTVTFPDGGKTTVENPIKLANFKAKVLGSLLDKKLGRDVRPWVQALVFLTAEKLTNALSDEGRACVVDRHGFADAILTVLYGTQEIGTIDSFFAQQEDLPKLTFTLGARPWKAVHIDWDRGVVTWSPSPTAAPPPGLARRCSCAGGCVSAFARC